MAEQEVIVEEAQSSLMSKPWLICLVRLAKRQILWLQRRFCRKSKIWRFSWRDISSLLMKFAWS